MRLKRYIILPVSLLQRGQNTQRNWGVDLMYALQDLGKGSEERGHKRTCRG